jgi:glycosyltransferase 2 family protein
METISPPPPKSSLKKLVALFLKIVITVACFWYISTKINFEEAWNALLKAKWSLLVIAVIFYFISKIISGFRLNINFRNIKLYLTEWDNMKLYWLGMFYNLFLPGAISGDAYKVIILNKTFKASIKKTSIAVLLDRVSGLLGLGVLLSVYGLIALDNYLYHILIIAGCLISILFFYLIIRSFFKDFLPGFLPTFLFGLLVQALQVVCVYFIMWSLGISFHNPEWIFIFLVSSAISVLPISLGGGLGTRELIFAEGARFFNMKPELGIIISLLFYLNNLLSSAGGAYFIFHSPLKKNDSVLQSN